MISNKVTFYSPGTFMSESSTFDVDDWDIKNAVTLSEKVTERYGAKPYAFAFQTYHVLPDITDADGVKYKVEPKFVTKSGLFFLGGKLETYDDVVARKDPKESILRDNMRFNGMWIVCINTNSYKSTLPFNETDSIVDAAGSIVESGDDPKYVSYRERMSRERMTHESI